MLAVGRKFDTVLNTYREQRTVFMLNTNFAHALSGIKAAANIVIMQA